MLLICLNNILIAKLRLWKTFIGALIILGAYQASQAERERIYGDSVIIWGTFEFQKMDSIMSGVLSDIDAFHVVSYQEFNEDDFEDELINAIAEGRGPDLIILPSEDMVKYRSKLVALPYDTVLSLRDFKDLYVDGAEVFTFPEGTYAYFLTESYPVVPRCFKGIAQPLKRSRGFGPQSMP